MVNRAEILERARLMELDFSKTKDFEPVIEVFSFGKYKGQTASEIMVQDPGYLVWCWDNIEPRSRLPFTKAMYRDAWYIMEDQGESDDHGEFSGKY